METVRPAVLPTSSTSSSSSTARSSLLLRSVTAKLGRSTRKPAPKGSDAKASDTKPSPPPPHKHKHEYLDEYASSVFASSGDKDTNLMTINTKHLRQLVEAAARKDGDDDGKAKGLEDLLANVFACVSAIKAAYAQIQFAQQPYRPEMIQAADATVVDELRRVSQLKQGYYQGKRQHQLLLADKLAVSQSEAEIQENKSLVKTYEITAKKLEAELQSKDDEVASLKENLGQIENRNQALEHRLRRHTRSASRSPAAASAAATLQGLHLSGLDPTHFLLALRYAVASVRDFVGVLLREMESAGWDLAAAASAIAPCAASAPPEARDLALESYVCMGMFSDLHLGPGFRVPPPDDAPSSADHRRRQCFEEFTAARSCDSAKDLARLRRPFAEFCRAKYAAVVRPQMEAAFFAGMDRRAMADADVFVAFAEMARRIWLLHWLFCSFEPDARAYMFRAATGARFSEVYMDSVGAESPDAARVGFTVVPGFRLRGTVIQCKVYLAATSSSPAPVIAPEW